MENEKRKKNQTKKQKHKSKKKRMITKEHEVTSAEILSGQRVS